MHAYQGLFCEVRCAGTRTAVPSHLAASLQFPSRFPQASTQPFCRSCAITDPNRVWTHELKALCSNSSPIFISNGKHEQNLASDTSSDAAKTKTRLPELKQQAPCHAISSRKSKCQFQLKNPNVTGSYTDHMLLLPTQTWQSQGVKNVRVLLTGSLHSPYEQYTPELPVTTENILCTISTETLFSSTSRPQQYILKKINRSFLSLCEKYLTTDSLGLIIII